MLVEAKNRALKNTQRYPRDMHAFKTYGDVGAAIARLTGDTTALADAIDASRSAESSILDPKLAEFRRNMENDLRSL